MEYLIKYTLDGKNVKTSFIKATSKNAAKTVFQINNPLAIILSVSLISEQ